jgi:hypothetical protein
MKKIIVTTWLLLISILGYSQCGNTDFETGDFTEWSGKEGSCCPIVLPNNGIVNGRQTIMTQGIDPHSCGGLNMVYSGRYSARVGNDRVRAQAEGLYYRFVVTPATTLIRYAYAVVFQDPGHSTADQPRFQSRVRLPDSSIIPCTDYTVTAASNLSGFQYCPGIDINGNSVNTAWRDWSVVALDLSAYVGQTVTLEFETGDCNLGAHYGYAYVDGIQCGRVDDHVAYCQGVDTATITASAGFTSYHWNTGDTTQTITVNPNLYDTLICTVTTYTGCQITLQYILDIIPGTPSFNTANVCLGLPIQLNNTSIPTPGYAESYNWNFGDNTTSTINSPSHIYNSVGTYTITLTSTTTGSLCNASVQGQVTIYPIPTISQITHN